MLPHPPRLGAFEKEDEMSQMRLIDENVEDLCMLIKGLHEEMSTMQRRFDALLAAKDDDKAALHKMVASGPALDVVPFEDETAPVVEACANSNESIKYPKWLQDINREARYLAAEAEVVWQQMEALKQSRTGKDKDAYITRTLRDKAVEFADLCVRSQSKRSEYDRARKEYQINGNK
jgi:hypothetical protein